MKSRIVTVLLSLALAGCSADNNDQDGGVSACEAHLEEEDGAGQACEASEDCPPVDCPCDDGSMTTVASCADGSCKGREGCPDACALFEAEYLCGG